MIERKELIYISITRIYHKSQFQNLIILNQGNLTNLQIIQLIIAQANIETVNKIPNVDNNPIPLIPFPLAHPLPSLDPNNNKNPPIIPNPGDTKL